jgi:ribonucleoside-diphosphate reductase alpha subunit
MFVIKRSGDKENVQFDKITSRLQKLLYGGLNKTIDPAIITQKICSRMSSGITTTELDNLASQICMGMIIDNPDFGTLGGRIVISNHQKNTDDDLLNVVTDLKNNKDIQGNLAPLVSEEYYNIVLNNKEILQNMIVYERDYLLDFFGFKTLERSYLLKVNEGKVKRIVERPQHLFIRVAVGIHGDDFESVKKTYDNLSLKNYTHATPTLFNAGTPHQQLSSCFLLGTEDSVEGIFETMTDCAKISKWSGGIGLHISNIRANGSYIRKTAGTSDGILPMLKVYNDIARYINQGGGKRNGSFAIYLEPHHADVIPFLEARKNVGPEEIRARDLFYALWVSDYFMECVEKNQDWYLMDPDQSYGLNEVYGNEYTELYKKYVSEGKYMKKIKARELWEHIIASQIEHGVPYIGYKDHVNRKSNQKNYGTIKSSNLCIEVMQYSDKNETAVCNLGSICLPKILEYPFTDEWRILSDSKVSVYEDPDRVLKIYSKSDCDYCKLLKALLKRCKLRYVEIDEEEVNHLRLTHNPDSKPFETVPQLFSVKDFDKEILYLGGYDDNWKLLSPKINYNKLYELAYELTVNLNKVIDINFYPTEKTRISNMKHRPIGLGVQGLADVFMSLKIPFTSDEACEINKEIFETIYFGSMSASVDLAQRDGYYPTYIGSPLSEGKFQYNLWGVNDIDLSGRWSWGELRNKLLKYGSRNSLNIALMPTASTASIFGNIESFEAITSNLYTRNVLSGVFTMINKYLIQDLIDLEIWNQDTKDRLIYNKGSVQNLKALPKFLRDVYKTSFEIDQKLIIKMSSQRGIFVCQSQSLNLFFDRPTFKELTACHFYGWKNGLKTGSYYIRTRSALSGQNFGLDPRKEKQLREEKINEVEEEGCLSCGA